MSDSSELRRRPLVRARADLASLPRYLPGRPPQSGPDGRRFKLSSNELPYGPLPGVLEEALAAASAMNRYPDMAVSGLTDALAAHLDVPAAHLATGTGSVGVLQQIVQAVAGPGDEVIFAWRSFEAYPIVVQVVGATAVLVPLAADGTHDLPAMADAVTARTRLVLLCTPNNPTGSTSTQSDVDAFLQAIPSDLLVVIDEAYVEFVRDAVAVDGLATARSHPNVAVLRTFSKAFGLAGLRVGFAVANPEVAMLLRGTSVPFGVSGVAQAAATASLAPVALRALKERVDAVVSQRQRVQRELAVQGWELPASQGNFVWLPLGASSAAFAQACDEVGVSVRPYGDDGVRVTLGEAEGLDRVLEVAAGFVGSAPRVD